MKNTFLTLLAGLLLICCTTNSFASGKVIINGKVTNTKAKMATLSYNVGLLDYIEHKDIATIDKKGNFQFVLDIAELEQVYLIIDEQQTSFYIQPNDEFTITTNYTDFDNSLSFAGTGSGKNILTNELSKKFYYGHERDLYTQLKVRSAEKFAQYCDSILNAKTIFINDFKQDPKPDGNFIAFLKNNLKYENAINKLQYAGYWSYLNNKGDTLPEMPVNYYNFLKQLSFDDEVLVFNDTYFSFLQNVIRHYVGQMEKDLPASLTHEETVELTRLIVKKENMMMACEAYLVQNALREKEFKQAEKYYNDYLKKYPNSVYSKELTEYYTKTKKISAGQPAPEFSIDGLDGKKYSLADFKGKVIYLDFWASWCGPCLRELPYAKKIKEEYEAKNILFLYISIDEDLASWKKAITEHDMKGMHLNDPNFDGGTAKSYNLRGVPSYFLIDKKGVIISSNAPRPSDGAVLKKMLDEALANN